jgi:hypothetical protein
MKALIILITCGFLFLIGYSMPPKSKKTVTSWLNVEYINCLSKKLPCDCEKLVNKYISINVDTSLDSNMERIALYKHSQTEPFSYKLRRLNKSKYEILTDNEKSKMLGEITFNNGSLYLHDKNGDTRYVNIGTSNELVNYNYQVENVMLINRALKKSGYPSLNTTLSEDSLRCACNKGVNMVSVKGKPKAWILEKGKDILYIYKIINEDADPDEAIVKKKIYQYKMK